MAQLILNSNSLLIAIGLAILPSLIWLMFYLKEDIHPEPKRWLFMVFAMGVALAPLAIFLEIILTNFFKSAAEYLGLGGALLVVIIAPLVEEAVKYGIVHVSLNKNPVLDEPVDGMIYIIVAALGFAAIENVFAIFSFIPKDIPGFFGAALNFVSLRFISAVALHGLASGIAGYFFAKFYFMKKGAKQIIWGVSLATILHASYNFLIVKSDNVSLILVGIILGGATALVIHLFNRLKHYKTYQVVELDLSTNHH